MNDLIQLLDAVLEIMFVWFISVVYISEVQQIWDNIS